MQRYIGTNLWKICNTFSSVKIGYYIAILEIKMNIIWIIGE
jgi:hypothetical protein